MKIEGRAGEFFYKALIRFADSSVCGGFSLTTAYYSSLEGVKKDYPKGTYIKWPVDEVDRGVIYVPTPEEYQ